MRGAAADLAADGYRGLGPVDPGPLRGDLRGEADAVRGLRDGDQIPGLDAGYVLLTRVLPLGRGKVVERDGTVFVR